MNRYLENSWFCHAVLIAALAAGGLTTLVVPSYEQIAATNVQKIESRYEHGDRSRTSHGVTGVDADQRQLKSIDRTT